MREAPVADALRQRAAIHGGKPAIVMADTGAVTTFDELSVRADRIAALFSRLGLAPGETIALLAGNERTVPEIWWGARRGGLYYVPLSTRLRAAEIAFILQDSGARLLLAGQSYGGLAREAVDALEGFTVRLVVDAGAGPIAALEGEAASPSLTPATTPALVGRELIYSSGTTGRPKGIKRPLVAAESAMALPELEKRMRVLFEFDADTVYLSVSPLYHATGRFVNRAIEEGGTAIILPSFDPVEALRAIQRHRVTHSQWVPTMFGRLLALPDAERRTFDLSSHRFALHAAAPCPVPVKRAMIDWWGKIVHEYYGGTENAGVTYIRAEDWLRRPGSVGRSISGTIHILDEDGSERELPAGEIGLIYFDGGVEFTYLNDDGSSARTRTSQGYLTYGDLGHVDADGFLYISDRRSDLIITGGVNVYPKEVELVLETHPEVQEVAVVGLADPEYGQRVVAVVAGDPGTVRAGLADELIAYCRDRLSGIKCPRSVLFMAELPRNENGKLLKRLLRERLEAGQGIPSA